VTDRQTDGRTDRRTELRWLRRAIAVPAVARKKARVFSLGCYAIVPLEVFCEARAAPRSPPLELTTLHKPCSRLQRGIWGGISPSPSSPHSTTLASRSRRLDAYSTFGTTNINDGSTPRDVILIKK